MTPSEYCNVAVTDSLALILIVAELLVLLVTCALVITGGVVSLISEIVIELPMFPAESLDSILNRFVPSASDTVADQLVDPSITTTSTPLIHMEEFCSFVPVNVIVG